jgi:hypothetical protein
MFFCIADGFCQMAARLLLIEKALAARKNDQPCAQRLGLPVAYHRNSDGSHGFDHSLFDSIFIIIEFAALFNRFRGTKKQGGVL